MSARVPLVILPRELGQVPPPLPLIGHKARGLAQLLALKARVPRFGILTAEAFDAHVDQPDIKAAVDAARAQAQQPGGWPDDAARVAHGEAIVRAVLRSPLPVAVRIGLHELLSAFAEEDVLCVRASVVGEPVEASVLTGALDSALGIQGKEALEEAVLRILALAFHPRTLALRESAGLPATGCRLALVVQRMVLSESSGVCVSLETALHETAARSSKALVRGCWGLGGGIGGKQGNPRIPSDVVRVERPVAAADGIDDDARVEMEIALKEGQLKLESDGRGGKGTRMIPVADHLKRECCVSAVQARMVAKEALRLEAGFGKPQVVSWAFAGRLLHILDVEPLLVPVTRIESDRARTWDDRLLPSGLLGSTAPLTFSVWQRAGARGVERAGRILGVKGVILEDTRPQMPRLVGHVSGRVYGNVEVLTALLDLLPFADKARAALASATGQGELVPRRQPPPGFWQRQRQKLDEGRWPGQLEKISETALEESARFRAEVRATLDKVRGERLEKLDPDALIDIFDELEDALSKVIAGLVLSGLAATLHQVELDAVVAETELKDHAGLVNDLFGGELPPELVELSRRVLAMAQLVRRRPALTSSLAARDHLDAFAARLLEDAPSLTVDEKQLADDLRALLSHPAATCTGELTLEAPRFSERPDLVLDLVGRLAATKADEHTVDELLRAATGARKKAEYTLEQVGPRLKGSARKRFTTSLDGIKKHGRDVAADWIPAELLINRLRATALALGERLFEHALLDQPRDVMHLTTPEIAGLVRGTGVDQDGKPLVASRKRQAAARPSGLPRRIETRGVVATSLLNDDENERQTTEPQPQQALAGRSVSSGLVTDGAILLEGNPLKPGELPAPSGVVVARVVTLKELPLLLAARAVVAERGTTWGPAAFALRALGVPTVVDAPQATSVLAEGEALTVDAAQGVVRRAPAKAAGAAAPARPLVDAMVFAREAVLSDPRARLRVKTPAEAQAEIAVPPLVRPPAADPGGFGEPTDREPVQRPIESVVQRARRHPRAKDDPDEFIVMPARVKVPKPETTPHERKRRISAEETDIDDNDIVEETDAES
jgi:pyruvate,water dikinase